MDAITHEQTHHRAEVAATLKAGHLRSETAQLLTDQANTLIQAVSAL